MAAIAKNRRFAKIHLKIISSETAGLTLSQVSDFRLLGASSIVEVEDFIYIFAVNFIGGGNRRNPPTCRKLLPNFIT